MSATTTKRRSKKTPEQRAAEAERLHAQLTAQVEAMASTEGWQRWLRICQSMHAYSLRNTLLIMAQAPHASMVMGYRAWQKHGRQVRKGSQGIKILGYSVKKITETCQETGEEREHRIPRFPVLTVFDISQTDGEPLPEASAQRLQGEDPDAIAERAAAWITSRGWTVTHEEIPGEINGHATGSTQQIVIDSNLSPAMTAKTTLHEVAHALLHFEEDGPTLTRQMAEVEAESVAFVVAGALGLDTSDYSTGYVVGWANGSTDLVHVTAGRVLGASQTILEALQPEPAIA